VESISKANARQPAIQRPYDRLQYTINTHTIEHFKRIRDHITYLSSVMFYFRKQGGR